MSDAVTQVREAGDALVAVVPNSPDFALPTGGLAPVVAGALGGCGRGDWVVAGPRERAGLVLRGATIERLAQGYGLRPYKLAPSKGAPGHRSLHAVGLALSSRKCVLCFVGNAGAATGAFYEALNTAALTGAPVLFVLALQELTADAPLSRQLGADPVALAQAFDLYVNEADPDEAAVSSAVAEARETGRPSVVVVRIPHT